MKKITILVLLFFSYLISMSQDKDISGRFSFEMDLNYKANIETLGVFHKCQFHRYFLIFKMLIYKGKLQF